MLEHLITGIQSGLIKRKVSRSSCSDIIKTERNERDMKLCMGCMNEIEDHLSTCPYCGFNETALRQESYYLDPGTIIGGKYIVGDMFRCSLSMELIYVRCRPESSANFSCERFCCRRYFLTLIANMCSNDIV